jgi:hypothetical protein
LVSGNEFQCFNAGITFPELEVAICKDITDIDPEARKGVLDTISAWEREVPMLGIG